MGRGQSQGLWEPGSTAHATNLELIIRNSPELIQQARGMECRIPYKWGLSLHQPRVRLLEASRGLAVPSPLPTSAARAGLPVDCFALDVLAFRGRGTAESLALRGGSPSSPLLPILRLSHAPALLRALALLWSRQSQGACLLAQPPCPLISAPSLSREGSCQLPSLQLAAQSAMEIGGGVSFSRSGVGV